MGAASPEYVPPSSVATGFCLITAFARRPADAANAVTAGLLEVRPTRQPSAEGWTGAAQGALLGELVPDPRAKLVQAVLCRIAHVKVLVLLGDALEFRHVGHDLYRLAANLLVIRFAH